MKIGIVITAYNNEKSVIECIKSICSQNSNFELFVVLVNDGSTDSTTKLVENKFEDIKIIYGTGNDLWSKSVNKGIKYCITRNVDYILLTNADCFFVDDFIIRYAKFALNKKNAICGPIVADVNTKKYLYSNIYFNSFLVKGVYSSCLPKAESVRDINGVKFIKSGVLFGRGLWLPNAVIKKVGLLPNNKLPQYGADTYYVLKAKKAGFETYTIIENILFTDTKSSRLQYNNKKKKISLKEYFFSKLSPEYYKIGFNISLIGCPIIIFPFCVCLYYLRSFYKYFK